MIDIARGMKIACGSLYLIRVSANGTGPGSYILEDANNTAAQKRKCFDIEIDFIHGLV